MSDDNEIWKDIEGYEGLYQVSNMGNIKGLDRYVTVYRYGKPYSRLQKGGIIKIQKDQHGYNQVQLHKGNRKSVETCRVCILVAKHFIPNQENKPCVDHINTIRDDDRACNLRWVSYKENANNPLTKERYKSASKKPRYDRRKPVSQYTKDGVFIREWDSAIEASDELGIHLGSIYGVCHGREHYNTAGGFIWKYAS